MTIVNDIIQDCLKEGRKKLTEHESSKILAQYGVTFPVSIIAKEKEELEQVLKTINYPIVMKIHSPDILHKTDAKCIFLNISDREMAEQKWDEIIANAKAYNPHANLQGILIQEMLVGGQEIIVGGLYDSSFGPVIMAGLGGIYTEVFRDINFRLAPIEHCQALTMLEELKVHALLKGARGEKEADIDALATLIVAVSRLLVDIEEIAELDINPVKVFKKGKGCIAVDGLITLK